MQQYDCRYVQLSIDRTPNTEFLWSTGDSSNTIITDKIGMYYVIVFHPTCCFTDSIYVDRLPTPVFSIGVDTTICGNMINLETNEKGDYLWSTSETDASIIVTKPGNYWLTINRDGCSSTDSIYIKECDPMEYFIPNVLTPNNDGVNDLFKVYGSNINSIEMEIFNRWGELLYQTSGENVAWDGSFMGEICIESVYLYKIKLTGKRPGEVVFLKGYITLMR